MDELGDARVVVVGAPSGPPLLAGPHRPVADILRSLADVGTLLRHTEDR